VRGERGEGLRKGFFFEKKQQKTFDSFGFPALQGHGATWISMFFGSGAPMTERRSRVV
jgi:hypothetical protein